MDFSGLRMRDVVDSGGRCRYSFVWRLMREKFFKQYFGDLIEWQQGMEKTFVRYYGEHYKMAFFYNDTMNGY